MPRLLITILFACICLTGFSQIQRKSIDSSKSAATMADDEMSEASHGKKINTGKALKKLNLTREQKLKLKEIRADAKSTKEVIMKDESLTADQKKNKLKEFRKATAEKIRELLTDEQNQKLKAMRKEGQ